MKRRKSNENYLTVKEIASALKVSEEQVRGYIRNGELEPKKTKKQKPYLVHKKTFELWLQSHTTGESNDE